MKMIYDHYITNADRLTNKFRAGTTVYEIDTGDTFEKLEVDAWQQTSAGGADYVASVGLPQQPHDREVTCTNVNPAGIGTILLPAGVYSTRFKVSGGAAGDRVKFVSDASPTSNAADTAQASNWLTTVAVDPTIDIEFRRITQNANPEEWSAVVSFAANSEGVRRLDFLAEDGAGPYTISIETGV